MQSFTGFVKPTARSEDAETVLRQSFDDVVRKRQADLADRLVEIDAEAAIGDLMPLVHNYLSSEVFQRVELARASSKDQIETRPDGGVGLWSELSFRLRRRFGNIDGCNRQIVDHAGRRWQGIEC